MGQRHQIFIKTHNPVKTDKYMSDEDKKKARKLFGNKKYTIIALHHGWLYGLSAVANIVNVMNATKDTEEVRNSVFTENPYMTYDLDGWIDKAKTLLEAQLNPKHPRGIGVEKMLLLNEESKEYMSDCTIGDNNDGITIIDTINRTYCMMNIFTFEDEDGDTDGIYGLPSMKPVSAMEYAKAYYPDEDDADQVNNIVQDLDEYEVMTEKELAKLFPKNFKKDLVI